jgi:hypothetical protein
MLERSPISGETREVKKKKNENGDRVSINREENIQPHGNEYDKSNSMSVMFP